MQSSLITLATLILAQAVRSSPLVDDPSPDISPAPQPPTSSPQYDPLNPIATCAAITVACDLCLAEFHAVLFCDVFAPGCEVCFPLGWPCLCLLGDFSESNLNPQVDPPTTDGAALTSLVLSISASMADEGAVTPPTGLPINDGNPAFGVVQGD